MKGSLECLDLFISGDQMVPRKVMSVAKIIWTCKLFINPGCILPSALGRVTALPKQHKSRNFRKTATIIHPTPTKEMMTPTVPTFFRFKMCVFFSKKW